MKHKEEETAILVNNESNAVITVIKDCVIALLERAKDLCEAIENKITCLIFKWDTYNPILL